ncbi:protein translocase subunit secB [Bosea sp. BK604]|nr:protein translocase subunit secB [Bosea sp. BK604]
MCLKVVHDSRRVHGTGERCAVPNAGTARDFSETACQKMMGPMANDIPNGNGAGTADAAPSVNALIQYTKDFSFENPKAPRSLSQQEAQQGPQMSLQVNVSTSALSETEYETVLQLEGKAEVKGETLFAFDLSYAGVFRLVNIPQEHVHPVLVIDCARLLFPFARQIIADAVQAGGFPPFYVPTIDFAALFQQRMQQLQAEQGANA